MNDATGVCIIYRPRNKYYIIGKIRANQVFIYLSRYQSLYTTYGLRQLTYLRINVNSTMRDLQINEQTWFLISQFQCRKRILFYNTFLRACKLNSIINCEYKTNMLNTLYNLLYTRVLQNFAENNIIVVQLCPIFLKPNNYHVTV